MTRAIPTMKAGQGLFTGTSREPIVMHAESPLVAGGPFSYAAPAQGRGICERDAMRLRAVGSTKFPRAPVSFFVVAIAVVIAIFLSNGRPSADDRKPARPAAEPGN